MLFIGHDHGAVRELDLEAGTLSHDLGGRHDACRPAGRVQENVAHADRSHGRPAVGRRQRCIQSECLPDPRTGRHDDHLARVQAVGDVVEVGEAGGHAEGHPTARGDGVDLVHRRLEDVLEGHVVLGDAAVGDLVDGGLGAVDDVVGVRALGPVVAELHDARARLDEASQDRAVGDDLGVVAGVGGRGHRGDEGVQVRRPADAQELAPALELGGDGDGVGGLPAAVEVQHALVDRLVGRTVEVVGLEHLDDVGDGVLAEQDRAEHRLFGGEVLGRLPVELGGRSLLSVLTPSGRPPIVQYRHVGPLPRLGRVPGGTRPSNTRSSRAHRQPRRHRTGRRR